MEIEVPKGSISTPTPLLIYFGNGQIQHPSHSKHNPRITDLHLSSTTTKPHTYLLAGTTTTTTRQGYNSQPEVTKPTTSSDPLILSIYFALDQGCTKPFHRESWDSSVAKNTPTTRYDVDHTSTTILGSQQFHELSLLESTILLMNIPNMEILHLVFNLWKAQVTHP